MGERFTGKVAIVTGAGGGIGEAYARGLAAEGAAVVIAEINETAGQSVAESITDDGGRAVAVTTDVSDEASTQTMAAATVEAFGQIDILVNNAAIYGDMRMDSLLTVPWDYYQRFMSVNMNGALLC
ncbi:MAG TPA: SDR family NAD(P)-dependent oxidoreductase, partial [Nitriliruptorales bacterium]